MRVSFALIILIFISACRHSPSASQNISVSNPTKLSDSTAAAEKVSSNLYYHPDSLLHFILDSNSTQGDEQEYWESIRNTVAAKLFIEKMQEINSREILVKKFGLPAGAKILELTEVNKERTILLWTKNEVANILEDDDISCMSATTGSGYFLGDTYLSLINTRNNSIINTLEAANYEGDLAIPFAILNPQYADLLGVLKYHAIGGDSIKQGKAQLLFLDDYNGDGTKNEFALYQQEGCMLCSSALFGYSQTRDSLIQYKTFLKITGPGSDYTSDTTFTEICDWVDHAFIYKVDSSGSINFDIDYTGRGGTFDRYDLTYNKQKEIFEGTLLMLTEEKMKDHPMSFYDEPRRRN